MDLWVSQIFRMVTLENVNQKRVTVKVRYTPPGGAHPRRNQYVRRNNCCCMLPHRLNAPYALFQQGPWLTVR